MKPLNAKQKSNKKEKGDKAPALKESCKFMRSLLKRTHELCHLLGAGPHLKSIIVTIFFPLIK